MNYIKHIIRNTKCINCGIYFEILYLSMSEDNRIIHDDLRYCQLKSREECMNFIVNNTPLCCLTEEEYLIKSIIE